MVLLKIGERYLNPATITAIDLDPPDWKGVLPPGRTLVHCGSAMFILKPSEARALTDWLEKARVNKSIRANGEILEHFALIDLTPDHESRTIPGGRNPPE